MVASYTRYGSGSRVWGWGLGSRVTLEARKCLYSWICSGLSLQHTTSTTLGSDGSGFRV